MDRKQVEELKIWTDGSCTPSNGNGGIGVVFVVGDEIVHEVTVPHTNTTNNKMEIIAIATALNTAAMLFDRISRIELFTDSQYCLNIIQNNYTIHTNGEEWEAYKKALGNILPVCHKVHFHHTRGHSVDIYNNRADLLATIASGYKNPPKDFKLVTFWKPIIEEYKNHIRPMVIALDFDGTVVEHQYPEIGKDIGAVPVLRALQEKGHQFILYTMRDNHSCGRNCLKEAADWFSKNGINLVGVNCNPWQKTWTDSNKVYAPLYIDDAALGAPLKQEGQFGRPYIDWVAVVAYFAQRGLFTEDEAIALQKQIV